MLGVTETPLTKQVAQLSEELNSLTRQLIDISSNTASNAALQRISERVSDLAQQLSNYSKWLRPVWTVAGPMSHLEDELSNRAQNTRVNALENRITRLEDKGTTPNSQMESIVRVVDRVVDRFNAAIEKLQRQISEQRQVTDWGKKEYNLRLVKKAS